jgi:hypothetical protein
MFPIVAVAARTIVANHWPSDTRRAESRVTDTRVSSQGGAVFFTLAVVGLAVGTSYLRGGRLFRLADAPLHLTWLLLVGLGLQIAVDVAAARGLLADASSQGWLLLLVSQVLVMGWVVANRHLPGTVLIAVGLLLNAVVIAANGAMPVSAEALAALGAEPGATPTGKHTLMTGDTRLPWLADILPLPPLRSIISVGDIVLAAGLIPLVHALMTHRPAEERRRAGSRSHDADE